MSNSGKNIVTILGILTVAFAGYYFYSTQFGSDLEFTTNDEVLQNMLQSTQVFIERRQELEAVQIRDNISIFTDDRFRSLRAFSEPVTPQPVGRPNPFEPTDASATE
jgi:hypothetical protein